MSIQLTILPVNVEPKPDELFSSWLFRLADGNFTKAHTFCRFHLPGFNIWTRDIDKLATDDLLNRLSFLTQIDFERLYQTTLRSYEGRLFAKCNPNGNQRWILSLGIFHRTRKATGLQFCPKCLIDDGDVPYFRKSWRLALNVACTRCNILLHDACPYCASPITFFRNEIGYKHSSLSSPLYLCFKCRGDLRHAMRYPAKIGVVSFQKKLSSYIASQQWKDFSSVDYFNVLYQVLKFLRSKSGHYKGFKETIFNYEGFNVEKATFDFQLEKETILNREQLIRSGVWLLDHWPNRFIDLCKEAKIPTNNVIKDFADMPQWFSELASANLHQPSAVELSLMRKNIRATARKMRK